MNVCAAVPSPNVPQRRSSRDGCPGVAVRVQPQGTWVQLYLPLEDCMALRKSHLPSYQGVNDCPREGFSNMDFWVADAKEKNIPRSPSFGRIEIATTRCIEAQKGKGTASRKLTANLWKIF